MRHIFTCILTFISTGYEGIIFFAALDKGQLIRATFPSESSTN